MKNIIDALTSSYSLEGEFEVQKSIQFIEKMEDIELLKPYAINLFIRFGKSESVRKGLILMLKSAAEKSDNDVDDEIVKMIEEKLFPVK